jgi:hypothetical protein
MHLYGADPKQVTDAYVPQDRTGCGDGTDAGETWAFSRLSAVVGAAF